MPPQRWCMKHTVWPMVVVRDKECPNAWGAERCCVAIVHGHAPHPVQHKACMGPHQSSPPLSSLDVENIGLQYDVLLNLVQKVLIVIAVLNIGPLDP